MSVSEQHYSESYEQTTMKFYGGVYGSKRKNRLHFGGNLVFLDE